MKSTGNMPPDDARHGTSNGYINKGCRCQECKDAYAIWMREARARRASRPIPEHVHGTENGYCNYSCRCEQCIKVHREKRRADRQIKRFLEQAEKRNNPKEPDYVTVQKQLLETQGVV